MAPIHSIIFSFHRFVNTLKPTRSKLFKNAQKQKACSSYNIRTTTTFTTTFQVFLIQLPRLTLRRRRLHLPSTQKSQHLDSFFFLIVERKTQEKAKQAFNHTFSRCSASPSTGDSSPLTFTSISSLPTTEADDMASATDL